ncbi:MAG TPA: ABC transporter substrate-binding protein [Dehalococcoidia bacterium]|nr:ABC transporter substrate-binding protein [Dehalococcoidia bacterium]
MRGQSLKWGAVLLVAALALFAMLVVSCGGEEEATNGGSGTPASGTPSGDTTGVTDTEIRIGTLLPISGNPAAAWGIALSGGMKAYFDYINDQGGIYGRKIKLFVGDSQYSGPIAAETIRKLVEQDQIFLLQGSLGTAAHSAVYTYLEERGIPDMYILTGNSKWTVPVSRNRFTSLIDYTTEGRLLARYVFENYNGKKVGIIAQNDDYGKEGEQGMRDGLEELDADVEVAVQYYDESQSEVTAQVQRLKSDNVDVIHFVGGPVQAANMMKTARQTLNWDVPMMITSTNALEIVAQLAGYDNIEGVISAVIGVQAYQTEYPVITETKEIMAKYAPDTPFDNTSLGGYNISRGIVGFLKQAGSDLTRESFLDAVESLCKYMCETCLVPASTGKADHRLVEAEILARATIDRTVDPPTFHWEPFGEPIDYESTTDCVVPTPPPGAVDQPGPLLGSEMAQ